MFQEKLTELRPYVTGIRFVKDLPVVDVVLMENWDMLSQIKLLINQVVIIKTTLWFSQKIKTIVLIVS